MTLLCCQHWQIPLSKRFRALKLWFVLRSFGVQGLQEHVRKVSRRSLEFGAPRPVSDIYGCYYTSVVYNVMPLAEYNSLSTCSLLQGVHLAKRFEFLVRSDQRFEIPAERHLGMVVFRVKVRN